LGVTGHRSVLEGQGRILEGENEISSNELTKRRTGGMTVLNGEFSFELGSEDAWRILLENITSRNYKNRLRPRDRAILV